MSPGLSGVRCLVFSGALLSILWCAAGSFAQNKPAASAVPEPWRQKFVQYVDRRSLSEKALNLVGLTSNDVGRGFALIAGVTKYPNLPDVDRQLPAAAADIDALADYLKNHEFFDEIVVLKDADVTLENLEYFLQDYFPDRIRKSPKSRFLFAYSGHGMVEGPEDRPTGYLLKNTARSLTDKLNSINMTVLRVYVDQAIEAGYQTLVLINACHSGAFLSRRPFGGPSAGGLYLPKHGGAHAITAGGSGQLTWHDPKLGKGSVFFEKLLAGLGGQADTFPVYPDGHRGDGVITVDEIATYLREEVSLATNQEQIPIPADLALNRSLGGFFFLSRQKMVAGGIVPEWNPRRATAFGISVEEILLRAKACWNNSRHDQALPLLRQAAEAGNAEAAVRLGIMYRNGMGGLSGDDAQAAGWFRKAAEGGDALGMTNVGFMYDRGLGGLPTDDVQALSWYRKAAEAGDPLGMNNLGAMYANGRGGLAKDAVQAVIWYRKAAEAGDALGMTNLGWMHENGWGGLAKDDVQAVNWYRKAAEAGNGRAMNNLGAMYEKGQGGLARDQIQALSWYRKAAEAGDGIGMTNLGWMYENGLGALAKDEVQAVSWYQKGVAAGDAAGMNNLGVMYRDGRGGLPKDDAEAVNWLRRAAAAENAKGMANLGFMYENGRGGLPKDSAQAVSWYRKAAESGDAYAREALKRFAQ